MKNFKVSKGPRVKKATWSNKNAYKKQTNSQRVTKRKSSSNNQKVTIKTPDNLMSSLLSGEILDVIFKPLIKKSKESILAKIALNLLISLIVVSLVIPVANEAYDFFGLFSNDNQAQEQIIYTIPVPQNITIQHVYYGYQPDTLSEDVILQLIEENIRLKMENQELKQTNTCLNEP